MFFLSKRDIDMFLRLSYRQLLDQLVTASYSVFHMYMVWKVICIFLRNDSPIVCVLSESMEPGFKRGDILFLKPQKYSVGDILVYQVYEGSIPIVHRIIRKVGNQLLTKGDNNRYNDIGLYRPGRRYLEPSETRAGVFGYIPYFGLPTIYINTVPGLKVALLAIAGFSVLFTRE
ncbi:signal peptidase I [Pancytospora epiphaga]|nr:signal peptidase I [Pancytospora epiphaga]